MRLTDLIEPLQARLVGADAEFEALNTDSRQLRGGELFVALCGDRFDGHDFARAAVDRGACAMVVEREIDTANVPQLIVADSTKALGIIAALKRRQFRGQLVAVTGSSGKTSVKGLLREIFAVAGTVVATPGNFNNHIGVPISLMNLAQQQYAVIEIGTSHSGEIAGLVNLAQPNIALVNNVSAAHIAGFGSLAAIAREKGDIYSTLTGQDTAVINLDDSFASQFIAATRHCRQVGFSLTAINHPFPSVHARKIDFDSAGRASFELHYLEESVPVHLLLPGLHNVANGLAAAACALAAGVTLQHIASGLKNFAGEKGRMQIFSGPRNCSVIDDTYNANPGSVRAAIDYLSERPGTRILVLGDLGELGEAGPQIHRDIGQYAAQKTISALWSHGPLSAHASAAFGAEGVNFASKTALVEALLKRLDADSVILIKGSRSTRMEEVVQRVLDAKETSAC
jgi:UDP-N-acetylmuramoyl-tripeptide--D-alanyl-D-alanine ligase